MTGLGMCLGMGNVLRLGASNVLRMCLGVGNVLRLGMSRLPGLLM